MAEVPKFSLGPVRTLEEARAELERLVKYLNSVIVKKINDSDTLP